MHWRWCAALVDVRFGVLEFLFLCHVLASHQVKHNLADSLSAAGTRVTWCVCAGIDPLMVQLIQKRVSAAYESTVSSAVGH